nr:exocyst complex component 8-like [Cherax quadricarinatus]
MADLLVKKLTAEDFNAERYVQDLSHSSVGDLELRQQRQRIQHLAEETNAQLKKNVYMNYMQFIETAKEISYLESEMYQLSHLITEQKSLLTSLLELSVAGERGPGSAAQEMIEVNPQEVRKKRERENRKKFDWTFEKNRRMFRFKFLKVDIGKVSVSGFTGFIEWISFPSYHVSRTTYQVQCDGLKPSSTEMVSETLSNDEKNLPRFVGLSNVSCEGQKDIG